MSVSEINNNCSLTCNLQGEPSVYYYRPHTEYGEGNVFTGVCLSTGGRVDPGSTLWMHFPGCNPFRCTPWMNPSPPVDAPPARGCTPNQWIQVTPVDAVPSPQKADGQQASVRILLECILVLQLSLTSVSFPKSNLVVCIPVGCKSKRKRQM